LFAPSQKQVFEPGEETRRRGIGISHVKKQQVSGDGKFKIKRVIDARRASCFVFAITSTLVHSASSVADDGPVFAQPAPQLPKSVVHPCGV
jgi:hypothetical protein